MPYASLIVENQKANVQSEFYVMHLQLIKSRLFQEMEEINANNFQCLNLTKSILSEVLWEFKCLAYAIPSIILYFLVFAAIRLKKSNFSPTFVHLFSLSCIYNIACWLGDFTFTTLFSFSPMCEPLVSLNHTYYLSIPYFFYNYFPVANFVCSTAIAIHQLTAVFNPIHVDNIWTTLRHVVTCLSIIIPIMTGLHIILGFMMTVPLPNGYIYIKVDHFFKQVDFITAPLMNSIAGAVSFILITICTLASIAKMFLMKATHDSRIQMKVFLVACWMCSSSLIFGVYQIYLWYSRFVLKDDFAINNVVYYRGAVADLCFLPLPWVVLIVNKKVRMAIFHCQLKKQSISAVSMMTVSRYPRPS